ncbi:hypothetical protein [Chromobacterium subtsugae]|uniref:hypothetical protein n=1 Tax=Chromobacterium subtsugae TaxID=251747 RepID=UPI000AC7BA85|nr:hypothetical protein [Chromobacterium subtsugae]
MIDMFLSHALALFEAHPPFLLLFARCAWRGHGAHLIFLPLFLLSLAVACSGCAAWIAQRWRKGHVPRRETERGRTRKR